MNTKGITFVTLLGLFVLSFWSGHSVAAELAGITPIFDNLPLGYGEKKAAPILPPAGSNWDLKPFILRIHQNLISSNTLAFGVNCTAGKSCDKGFAAAPTFLVRLLIKGDNLLLVSTDETGTINELAPDPIARWKITGRDQEYLLVSPDLGEHLSFVMSPEALENQKSFKVHDRFFHDFRESNQGLWFHETIRYESATATTGTSSSGRTQITKGADTFTIFLLPNPFSKDFESKPAIEKVGFFTNAGELSGDAEPIYGPRTNDESDFNPNKYYALRWSTSKQTVEWVVDGRCPDDIFPTVKEGIEAWNPYLKNIQLVARKATEGEELDSPFKNVLFYEPGEGIRGGVANFSYHPGTGEIFRAAVKIDGPDKIVDSNDPATGTKTDEIEKMKKQLNLRPPYLAIKYGGVILTSIQEQFSNPLKAVTPMSALTQSEQRDALRGVVSHEVGHTLGLRHNFRGQSYVADLKKYPAGSSVMDYPKYFQNMKIGPYDEEAISWGYANSEPSGQYPFCTDEKAGWSFLILAYDPECQRWALPTDKFFEVNYAEAIKLINEYLPIGLYETDTDFSVFDLGLVLSYLRDPNNEYYDKFQNEKVYNLVGSLGGLPETSMLLGNFPYWSSMSVVTAGLTSQFARGVLSPKTLFQDAKNLDSIFDWISRYPGGDNIDMRLNVVLGVKQWTADPFGHAIFEKLRSRLEQEGRSSANLDVRAENAFLLQQLEKNP